MKALIIARKILYQLLREPQLLFLILALPLLFVWIAALTYGDNLLMTYKVQVLADGKSVEPLLEELEHQRYPDGRPVFDVEVVTDRQQAEDELKKQESTVLLIITSSENSTDVMLEGDPLYTPYYRASTLLSTTFHDYADRQVDRTAPVEVEEEPLFANGPDTYFDLHAPGLIVFALLLLIPQTAMLLGREIRRGTLRRLRLSSLQAWHLLGGISLAQMLIAFVQVTLIYLVVLALGFNNHGDLWLALLVGLVIAFAAIGQGLVVACFAHNDSQALNLGSTVTMLQVFLSGAFFQLPPQTVFALANYQIDLFDVFPATHGLLALQQALSYGADFSTVAFRLAATLLLSLLYFVVGIFVFQQRQMRKSV